METTAARTGAALLGIVLLFLALVGSVGAAILVPIGMFVGSRLAHRRGNASPRSKAG